MIRGNSVFRFIAPKSGFVQVRIDNLGNLQNAYENEMRWRPVVLPPWHRKTYDHVRLNN
jgi:hypothetical protein